MRVNSVFTEVTDGCMWLAFSMVVELAFSMIFNVGTLHWNSYLLICSRQKQLLLTISINLQRLLEAKIYF